MAVARCCINSWAVASKAIAVVASCCCNWLVIARSFNNSCCVCSRVCFRLRLHFLQANALGDDIDLFNEGGLSARTALVALSATVSGASSEFEKAKGSTARMPDSVSARTWSETGDLELSTMRLRHLDPDGLLPLRRLFLCLRCL